MFDVGVVIGFLFVVLGCCWRWWRLVGWCWLVLVLGVLVGGKSCVCVV